MRHPGYVGTLLAYVGTPIILGLGWAILLGIVSAVLMIVRTAFEDKTLLAELDGYKTYAARVRYRLCAGCVGLWRDLVNQTLGGYAASR